MKLIQKKLSNGIIRIEHGDGKTLETAYLISGTTDLTEATIASHLVLTKEYGDDMQTWTIDSLQLKKMNRKAIWIIVLKNGRKHFYDFSLVVKDDLEGEN